MNKEKLIIIKEQVKDILTYIDSELENFDKETLKVGDTVKVIDEGKTFSTYHNWKGLGKYKQNFVHDKSPNEKSKYTVLNIEPHNTDKEYMIALIQDPNTTQVFIIGFDGLKKVN